MSSRSTSIRRELIDLSGFAAINFVNATYHDTNATSSIGYPIMNNQLYKLSLTGQSDNGTLFDIHSDRQSLFRSSFTFRVFSNLSPPYVLLSLVFAESSYTFVKQSGLVPWIWCGPLRRSVQVSLHTGGSSALPVV
jgi:hypothetical protein